MEQNELRELLRQVSSGDLSVEQALLQIKLAPFTDLGYAMLDDQVYGSIWNGAFGTMNRTWITIKETAFLLCIAVGLAPAFKMRFWNIGAEGQILMGGVATAACMIYLSRMPSFLLLLVMLIASVLAGLIWGLIPAFFKARYNTNETLFTLMMNYVAIR